MKLIKLQMIIAMSSVIIIFSCMEPPSRQIPKDESSYHIVTIADSMLLPGKPEAIYDAITGDISPWWDHSFSENPIKFYIDARPGGGFYEVFDEQGNGVLHATVIYAQRGKLLRLDGPLGLSGRALTCVTTYSFNSVGNDSTNLDLSVHISGEIDSVTGEIVKNVWKHFLFERFKPYVESGKYLTREPLQK
jgi:hypothetical protein